MADLSEHVAKLYRISEGALRTCEDKERSKAWWEGYRQALDEISYFFDLDCGLGKRNLSG